MVTIGRWNNETHEYDPYTPDPAWTIVLYTQDMNLPINCTNCGKEMVYGDSYTSRELHNAAGFGFPVCEQCYNDEIDRAVAANAY
jgi:hypothetical protein